VHFLVFPYCDKIPVKNQLKGRKVYFCSQLQRFYFMVALNYIYKICLFGLCNTERPRGRGFLLSSWWLGGIEEGRGLVFPWRTLAPVTKLLSIRLHLLKILPPSSGTVVGVQALSTQAFGRHFKSKS